MSAPNRQDNPKSFASELVSDPDAVPSLRVLWGFIGDTSRPKHVRLYANLELSQYYDVPEEAIRGRRDVAKEDPLAGTYLWLDRAAAVVTGAASVNATNAAVQQPNQPNDLAGGANMYAAGGPTLLPYCQPTLAWCPKPTMIACPTHVGCPQPTRDPELCHTSWFACPATIGGPICSHHTSFPQCFPPITQNPGCPQITIYGPACGHPTSIPQCWPTQIPGCPHPVTIQPANCVTSSLWQCQTLAPPCGVQTVTDPHCFVTRIGPHCFTPGCPTGLACGPQRTLACPYPGPEGFGWGG